MAALVQQFAIQPTDRTAIVGDTIILPCRVVNRVGTLQWTKDGFGLGNGRDLVGFPRYAMTGNDEEGDYSLQITNVQLEDDAIFQCQVGPTEGTKGIRSQNAVVTVYVPPEPPKISEGSSLTTTAGQSVELTCLSEAGKPAAQLDWLDGDGKEITSGIEKTSQLISDGKRANSMAKLAFVVGREHDGKSFTCRSENQAMKRPHKVYISMKVKYPPDVQLTIDQAHVAEGEDIRLTCTATANPVDGMVYKWYKNDEVVAGTEDTVLVLAKVTKELNGAVIGCQVTNSVGSTLATQVLSVQFGPVFGTPLAPVTGVQLDQLVKLQCDVQGNPKPEITWLFEKSPRVLSTESELTIGQMTKDSAGSYLCRASVRGFAEIAASTHVFIKGPPKVTSSPVQYGNEGEIIKLECLVNSVPPSKGITWSHNSQAIEVDNSRGFELMEEKLPSESLIRNLLVIHKAKKEDFGIYNCSAWNEFGHDFMMITLTQQTTFPMLKIVGGIMGTLVGVVSLTIIVILCFKRTSNHLDERDYVNYYEGDYVSEIKKGHHVTNNGSSGQSQGSGSVTSSSIPNSNHHHHQLVHGGNQYHVYPPSSTAMDSIGGSSGVEMDIKDVDFNETYGDVNMVNGTNGSIVDIDGYIKRPTSNATMRAVYETAKRVPPLHTLV
ncbi:Irregular chiasm C-roughest protein [Halotydeus destructor]|nr:Irregular chiasm C-roughest protein [Halotydeus destructor]